MKRVVLVSCDAGYGHLSACDALAEGLADAARESVDIQACSFFARSRWLRHIGGWYNRVTARHCRVYDAVWVLTNTQIGDAIARGCMRIVLRREARNFVERLRADLIVVVHPSYAADVLAIAATQARGIRTSVVAFVTDLATVHRSWTSAHAAHTFVTTEAAAECVASIGVSRGAVTRVAFPVSARFARRAEPAAARADVGLDPSKPMILIAGGGAGSGPMESIAARLVASGGLQTIVVAAASNSILRERLRARCGGRVIVLPARVDLAPYLAAADVVISKAGPSLIHECAAVGVPLVLTSEVGPQERGNIAFAVRRGWGCEWNNQDPSQASLRPVVRAPCRDRAARAAHALLGVMTVWAGDSNPWEPAGQMPSSRPQRAPRALTAVQTAARGRR